MASDIIEIGNTLKLRDETDPAAKITTWFRQGLNIVDIMPAHFKLELTTETPSFSVYNAGDPIFNFQDRCKYYGLNGNAKMARLWLTGDSSFQEEVSNEYQTNTIESMVNGLMGSVVGSYANMFRSTTSGAGQDKFQADLIANTKSVLHDNTGRFNKLIGKSAVNVVNNIANTLIKNLLSYKYLSVPKTYSGSSYNPALNFNIRLISPYGHPKAIQKFIIDPLTYLMLLAPPTTNDGITYGNANYVSVRAYGIADIDLGIIENISIKRGGNDVAYNKYRQPMSIDVNLSIKPAAAGFASQQKKQQHYADKQTNSTKIATTIANATVASLTTGNMKSSMVTLGNMLESFKAMPHPDKMQIQQSPPNVVTSKPKKRSAGANKKVSKNTNDGNKKSDSLLGAILSTSVASGLAGALSGAGKSALDGKFGAAISQAAARGAAGAMGTVISDSISKAMKDGVVGNNGPNSKVTDAVTKSLLSGIAAAVSDAGTAAGAGADKKGIFDIAIAAATKVSAGSIASSVVDSIAKSQEKGAVSTTDQDKAAGGGVSDAIMATLSVAASAGAVFAANYALDGSKASIAAGAGGAAGAAGGFLSKAIQGAISDGSAATTIGSIFGGSTPSTPDANSGFFSNTFGGLFSSKTAATAGAAAGSAATVASAGGDEPTTIFNSISDTFGSIGNSLSDFITPLIASDTSISAINKITADGGITGDNSFANSLAGAGPFISDVIGGAFAGNGSSSGGLNSTGGISSDSMLTGLAAAATATLTAAASNINTADLLALVTSSSDTTNAGLSSGVSSAISSASGNSTPAVIAAANVRSGEAIAAMVAANDSSVLAGVSIPNAPSVDIAASALTAANSSAGFGIMDAINSAIDIINNNNPTA